MHRRHNGLIALAAVVGLGLGACGGGEEAPPMGDVNGEVPAGGREGMEPTEGMPMDAGMMLRHAEEADSMASTLRQHIDRMRQLPAEVWYDQMGEHVSHASRMLTLMHRQMREMDMGMGMSDEHMGEMMGMSGQEHRNMMDQMQALRTDLEQLQTATVEQVRELMPAHLDRLERVVGMVEESAEHMRAT